MESVEFRAETRSLARVTQDTLECWESDNTRSFVHGRCGDRDVFASN